MNDIMLSCHKVGSGLDFQTRSPNLVFVFFFISFFLKKKKKKKRLLGQ